MGLPQMGHHCLQVVVFLVAVNKEPVKDITSVRQPCFSAGDERGVRGEDGRDVHGTRGAEASLL